jgi:glycosyltransferase involved in cell wall biosynthesis
MKILWFTNTPSMADELLGSKEAQGGWIASLEKQVKKLEGFELGIAFHYNISQKRVLTYGTTTYFVFPKLEETRKIRKIVKRWRHEIEPEQYIDWYIEMVNDFKPDIVHIFGTEQSFGLIADRIAVPVIIQIQGNLIVYAKKWYSGLSSFDIFIHSRFLALIRALGLWHEYYSFLNKARREQLIFKSGKLFIGRTDWDRRVVAALSANATYFHCDELLRDEFHRNNWRKPSVSTFSITSTLSPVIYKGLETILETASILKKKPFLYFEWQVVGINGHEELVKIIEKKYRLKFVDQNVKFRGSLSAEPLIDILLNSELYVHPSHIENSPNSVCEAMLLGMPVIATYAGGTPSMLKDNEEGLLVQDGDPYALAGAIIELFSNCDFAITLGSNARLRALKRHDADKVVSDLLGIYKEVLNGFN